MKTTLIKQNLINRFEKITGEQVKQIYALPQSGSYRQYYRIIGETRKIIGVFNEDYKENRAFLSFTKHFLAKKLNVPKIYDENLHENTYLLEDLGDTTLFSYLSAIRENGIFPDKLTKIYEQVISEIPKFQILTANDLDYKVCYPRAAFDKQSMMWDVNYFKYYFLKLAKIPFDEQELEDDFRTFTNYLLSTDCNYFLYRDLQSRNIMLANDKAYFIDYQGGRRGALQYDIASLLFDAKADIPKQVREHLFNFYLENVEKQIKINRSKFTEYYQGYALIRIMQAMGAYGFRGFYEKKQHFLKSIPFALQNLDYLLNNLNLPIKIPTLTRIFELLIKSNELRKISDMNILTVKINSFSYKRGIPVDESGNGGGFVFDCRAIHNPGRYEEYKKLTGKDIEVIDFFRKKNEMANFLEPVFQLVDASIEKYQKRNFTSLMVNFGCTGGKHRSVYSAEKLKEHLSKKYPVKIILRHREQEMLKA